MTETQCPHDGGRADIRMAWRPACRPSTCGPTAIKREMWFARRTTQYSH